MICCIEYDGAGLFNVFDEYGFCGKVSKEHLMKPSVIDTVALDYLDEFNSVLHARYVLSTDLIDFCFAKPRRHTMNEIRMMFGTRKAMM